MSILTAMPKTKPPAKSKKSMPRERADKNAINFRLKDDEAAVVDAQCAAIGKASRIEPSRTAYCRMAALEFPRVVELNVAQGERLMRIDVALRALREELEGRLQQLARLLLEAEGPHRDAELGTGLRAELETVQSTKVRLDAILNTAPTEPVANHIPAGGGA